MLMRYRILLRISLVFAYSGILLILYRKYNLLVNFHKLREMLKCEDKQVEFKVQQRGDYFVLMNYVIASKSFACHEAITYTTHGDYTFLDNLPVLVERWNGPISVALYAPGDDLILTLASISYLRNCIFAPIKEYVTFHIFFPSGHFPYQDRKLFHEFIEVYNCAEEIPYEIQYKPLYRQRNNLTYPINIARNIAREAATTHFILVSDIELYPTYNFIKKFLEMLSTNPKYEYTNKPHVYVLPVFEIKLVADLPFNKTILQKMIKSGSAFSFHRGICVNCHKIPKFKEWIGLPETDDLQVFTVAKRQESLTYWEPVYVGTNDDPLFDERLSWEGHKNKMTQAYSMCLLDYDYMVLNNAFLTHKAGIKVKKEQDVKYKKLGNEVRNFIVGTIRKELIMMYGKTDGCELL